MTARRPDSASAGRRTPNGFTIVEIVVVLILIGVVTSISAPYLSASPFQLDSAVREVASTIAAAQSQAVLRQHDVALRFDTAHQHILVHADADNDGTVDSDESVRMVELGTDVAFGRGAAPERDMGGATVSFEKIRADLPAVVFHRNGSASEEGIVYLTSERAHRNGGFEQDARAVETSRSTGRVECWSYKSGQWRRSC